VRFRRAMSKILCSRPCASLLCAVPREGAVVLRYHSVNDDPVWGRNYIQGSLAVPPHVFDSQMSFLASRYDVVGIGHLARLIADGELVDRRLAAITFDDGYEDNYRNALPILRNHGLEAAFYVTTGSVGDSGVLWTVRLRHAVTTCPHGSISLPGVGEREVDVSTDEARERAVRLLSGMVKRSPPSDADRLLEEILEACGDSDFVPDRRIIMNEDEIRRMRDAGMTIGAHTVNHYNLTCLENRDIAYELRESRRFLEEVTGEPVRHLAYPDGRTGRHFDGRVASVAMSEGFTSAVTSIAGPASREYPAWSIPRLGVVPSHRSIGRLAFDMQRVRLCRPHDDVFEEVRAETGVRAMEGG